MFVTGEYNWGVQPGLKNTMTELPGGVVLASCAIASYSFGRLARETRSSYAWHNTLNEMGMVVISSTLTVGGIQATLDEHANPIGEGGEALKHAFPRFADDLRWWTEATLAQKVVRTPPF